MSLHEKLFLSKLTDCVNEVASQTFSLSKLVQKKWKAESGLGPTKEMKSGTHKTLTLKNGWTWIRVCNLFLAQKWSETFLPQTFPFILLYCIYLFIYLKCLIVCHKWKLNLQRVVCGWNYTAATKAAPTQKRRTPWLLSSVTLWVFLSHSFTNSHLGICIYINIYVYINRYISLYFCIWVCMYARILFVLMLENLFFSPSFFLFPFLDLFASRISVVLRLTFCDLKNWWRESLVF